MFLYHEPQGNHARSGKKKGLMAHRVLCSLYKKILKKMQIKILFNVPNYPETRGELPTTPAKEIAH